MGGQFFKQILQHRKGGENHGILEVQPLPLMSRGGVKNTSYYMMQPP